jgi:acyl dehydratase
MRDIANLAELKTLIGQEVALTDWIMITQERINLFADATDDHQWIHVDIERCARESPFGSTIAHGFMTLSLLSGMLESAFRMVDARMVLNYGLNKLRFPSPVPVNSRLRLRLLLSKVEEFDGGAQCEWLATIEREGSDKPACVAEVLLRRYP